MEILAVSVEEFLPGTPLGRLARDRGRQDQIVGRAVRNAGAVLAAIHEVRTTGFGRLRADGTAPLSDWPVFLAERFGAMPADPFPEITAALTALEAETAALRSIEPRLLHFDFEPSHLLVDEGTGGITGVIDMEEAISGDPTYEFAQWDVIHDAYAPVDELARGYAERAPLTPDFERRRLLSEIHFRARELAHGSLPDALVPISRRRLSDALAALT